MAQAAHSLADRVWMFVWFGLFLLIVGQILPPSHMATAVTTGATANLFLALIIAAFNRRYLRSGRFFHHSLDAFVSFDATPTLCTDDAGEITYANGAARSRFGSDFTSRSLVSILNDIKPNPAGLILRLQQRTAATGSAHDDVMTADGVMRLGVHALNGGHFIWRLDHMVETGNKSEQVVRPISLPMFIATKNGTILFMNEALRRKLGRRVFAIDRLFQDLPLKTGGVHRLTTKNGSENMRVFEYVNTAGQSEVFLVDSPNDLPAGAALRRSFDELPVALLKIAPGGDILVANRIARKLLGHPMNGTVHLGDLVKGLGRSVPDWLAEGIKGRSLHKPEIVQAVRGNDDLFLQITLSRAVEDGEQILIAVLNDATELKTLEAQFVQSQKMQAIGQLAGGVAHDFNNLLTAITGYCDLLLLRHDEEDADFGDLEQINQNANRAAALVGQLLAFSRKQNLQPETLDLRDTLGELTHLLNRLIGDHVALELDHARELSPIRADKRQFEQVVMNLVVNARDAMKSGGEIRIVTENVTFTKSYTRDHATLDPGEYVCVKVSDTGTGIAPDRLAKLFEPFYTTKNTGEGTGLGLSTAYGIVKQSGGFIFVDSVEGSGSVFSVYFPAHTGAVAAPLPALKKPVADAAAPNSAVVLLVEDEAPVRAFAARALGLSGHTVLQADCGEQALKQLVDTSVHVDVIVTDVIMPGMDGPTWVSQALKTRPDLKVIFVSGYAEESFAQEQARIPNSEFLPKPFSLNQLTARVQAQMQ